MFTLDGVEDTDVPNQIQSSEEESDTDGNIILKIICVFSDKVILCNCITKMVIFYHLSDKIFTADNDNISMIILYIT